MATPEFYPIRQNLAEKKKYTFDYSYWLESGDSVSTVESTAATTTSATVSTAAGTDYANVIIGPATTAGSDTLTITMTTANGEIDVFKITLTEVADTA